MATARARALPRHAVVAVVIGVLAVGCTSGNQPRAASTPAAAGSTTPAPAAGSSTTRAPSASPLAVTSASAVTSAGAVAAPSATVATPGAGSNAAPDPPSTPPTAHPAVTTSDRFTATSAPVTAAELGKSWHAGCPVGPSQLRTITLSYWGFDDAPHIGSLVVSASVVTAATRAFHTLFTEHFPIRGMQPTSAFGGSDDASMAVDNTSAFNCRYAVATGTPRWSAHAYGKAIDINTVENPYLLSGKVLPPMGAPYLNRTPFRPGMAVPGGQLVKAFAAAGWQWGGRWSSSPDYQHFSADGG